MAIHNKENQGAGLVMHLHVWQKDISKPVDTDVIVGPTVFRHNNAG